MSATYREAPITFEAGLNTQYEASLIPEGSLSVLENWVPEETQGVRVRQGWKKTLLTGGPTTSKGFGLAPFSKIQIPQVRQRVRQDLPSWNGSPNVSVTWEKATKAGSTLVVIVGYGANGVLYLDGTIRHNYQCWHSTLNNSSDLRGVYVLVNNNAASETSTGVLFNDNISTGGLFIDAYELEQAVVGSTPKNLLNSFASSYELSGTIENGMGWWDKTGTLAWSSGPGPQTALNKKTFTLSESIGPNATSSYFYTTGLGGVPVTGSTNYVFSWYYARNPGGQQAGFGITNKIKWYDINGALISTSSSSEDTSLATSTTWVRRQFSATSPSNARYAAPGWDARNLDNTNGISYWRDAIQFELGTTATDWVFGSLPQGLIEQQARGFDSTNPISLSVPTTTTSSISWTEAVVANWNSTAITYSGWTNSFVEDGDASVVGGAYRASIGTAHRLAVSSGTNVNVDVTESTAGSSEWLLFTIPFAYTSVEPQRFYVAAHDDTTSIKLYYIDKATVDTGSWTLLESLTLTPGGIPVAYSSGLGSLIYTHPGMANPRSWAGLSTTPVPVSAVVSGVSTAYFKTRFFIGGDVTLGSRLFYSDIGDLTSWPAANFIDIGKDDGEKIDDLASTQNLLVIGKASGIWTLSGSGPDTFFLSQMPYGEAAPGRSIAITPFGAIVAGKTGVWSVVSSTVENISEKLGADYAPAGYVHTGYAAGKVYVLDKSGKTIYVYDLKNQIWHKETLVSDNNQPVALIGETGKRLLAQPASSTDTGLLYYKDQPSLTRDRDFYPITAKTKLKSPLMWLVGPRTTMTPRYLFLQIRQRGSGENKLRLTVSYDESSGDVREIKNRTSSQTYRERIDVGAKRGAHCVQFTIEGPDNGTQYDIESALLGYDENEVA